MPEIIDLQYAKSLVWTVTTCYDAANIILYNLALGASGNDLSRCFEGHPDFHALPTFGILPVIAVMGQVTRSLPEILPGFQPQYHVHGEHHLELKASYPTAATLKTTARIVDIVARSKGVMVKVGITSVDHKTGIEVCFNEWTSFILHVSGRGASSISQAQGVNSEAYPVPEHPPDAIVAHKTSLEQGALYRAASGDLNPLHIDPTVARAGGFPAPILTGTCTMGIGIRHVIDTFAKGQSNRFKSAKLRFTKPVFPGEVVSTYMWHQAKQNRIIYQQISETGNVVISQAAVYITDEDKVAGIYHDLENPSRTLSWRQGRSLVRKLVAGFQEAGLKRGECFSIASFNDIMYSMCFLGGVGAGGVFSGTNPAYQAYELRHHIRTAQVRLIIVEPELLPPVLDAARLEGLSSDMIFIFNTRGQSVPQGFKSWEWLLDKGERDWIRIHDVNILKCTDVARLSTSGTTGPPKTAMQSHYNATSWHTMMFEINPVPWEVRNLFPLPGFHVATVPAVHASPFRLGHACWIMRRFELESFLAAVEKHKITNLGIVPPLVIAIIMSPLQHKYSLRSLRKIGCGAAPLDAASQKRFQALCAADSTFTQVFGMTETTGACSLFYHPDSDDTGSVGSQFMPNTDVKLIDDCGEDITNYGVRGELCIRGPTVVRGYFDNDKANAESFDHEGFFKTGDILYCDEASKKWYIVDRKKELVKVRGFQVAPPELEAMLLSHPDIVDCAVIGVQRPGSLDEAIRAFVVRRDDCALTTSGVKDYIKANLASYKAITGGVFFVDEIPKSPSGKILKRVLREQSFNESHKSWKL